MSGGEARRLGGLGEDLAAEELQRRGFRILARGYRCRFGEIDLVAEDGAYLVFTEVKLRRDSGFSAGREAVDARKQAKLRITAEHYLAEHPENALQPRFDVAEIYAPQGTQTRQAHIIYIENAF